MGNGGLTPALKGVGNKGILVLSRCNPGPKGSLK